jgi:hypothetical protein
MENSIVRDEVLTSIDCINESVDTSILAVFCSIIQEYEKISVMIDNAEDDYFIYQEGQIWDTATGKGKVESGFMKLIAFIPRLFQGMFNAITSLFKKNDEKDVTKNMELAKNAILSADQNQLAEAANAVNKTTEDNLGFDPNKKEFVLKRGLKHIRNWIFIVTGLKPIFNKLILKIKGGETQYDAMAKELYDVLKGNKSIDSESFYASIDTLNELYSDGYKASMGIRGLTSELSMLLEKKMREDFADGKNVEKQASAKKLLDNISKSSKHVMSLTFALGMISKAAYVFGGPLYRKLRKGKLDQEDVELTSDTQEIRELKNKLKALKQQEKTLKADKKRKDAKRAEILKLEEEIKKLEKRVPQATASRDSAKNDDERGDILWNEENDKGEKRHGVANKANSRENWDTRSLDELQNYFNSSDPDII